MMTGRVPSSLIFFFFNDTATTEIYTLSLHDALPICTYWNATSPWIVPQKARTIRRHRVRRSSPNMCRSEEHTSELQSLRHLVCRLLLEKKQRTPLRTAHRSGLQLTTQR